MPKCRVSDVHRKRELSAYLERYRERFRQLAGKPAAFDWRTNQAHWRQIFVELLKAGQADDLRLSPTGKWILPKLADPSTIEFIKVPLTDAGLSHLATMTRLSNLTLSSANVTGSGFADLQMPQLEKLALRPSNVNDEGLASMTDLTGLSRLDLSDTKITDASAAHLRKWWQNVRASKGVDVDPPGGAGDPFGGGGGDPFGGGAGDPFAGRGPSCFLSVLGTRFSTAAAAKLNKGFPPPSSGRGL